MVGWTFPAHSSFLLCFLCCSRCVGFRLGLGCSLCSCFHFRGWLLLCFGLCPTLRFSFGLWLVCTMIRLLIFILVSCALVTLSFLWRRWNTRLLKQTRTIRRCLLSLSDTHAWQLYSKTCMHAWVMRVRNSIPDLHQRHFNLDWLCVNIVRV